MADATYIKGAELEDVLLTWNHPTTGLYTDFVSGWSFSALIGNVDEVNLVTKTLGFTPAATAPNLTIAWASGELDPLPVGVHTVDVQARHIATSKDRKTTFSLEIRAAVLPTP
jgi:hypothetical protein